MPYDLPASAEPVLLSDVGQSSYWTLWLLTSCGETGFPVMHVLTQLQAHKLTDRWVAQDAAVLQMGHALVIIVSVHLKHLPVNQTEVAMNSAEATAF
ncbi:hypothetical protein CB1_001435022 [Camelus ferus]|nr:hypothetical protein CB1_001435022 [Camelus ferus]